jgi:hypothetical protein
MATIRRATINDAARIAETHVRSWQSAYHGLIPQDYLDSLDPAQRLTWWEQVLASVNWAVDGVLVVENELGPTGSLPSATPVTPTMTLASWARSGRSTWCPPRGAVVTAGI